MFYKLTVVQYSKMLGNLSAILDKANAFAESKKIDASILLNSRLAPDQFNLIRQVQIACDSAKLGVARLIDQVEQAPKHEDTEATLVELKDRIKSVQDYLATITEEAFVETEHRQITMPRWDGKTLTGLEFALQYATPNVYFHITTAYAILRHNGVEVGKKDFLGNLPYQNT